MQTMPNDCGPASLKMIFDHYRIPSTLSEIDRLSQTALMTPTLTMDGCQSGPGFKLLSFQKRLLGLLLPVRYTSFERKKGY
ncbi:MAG: cysteine peptidase family C39 domain-containing protein [Candidatus Kryptoniota bacterium]